MAASLCINSSPHWCHFSKCYVKIDEEMVSEPCSIIEDSRSEFDGAVSYL